MVLLLQPAAYAICDADSSPLWIMSELKSCFEGAKFGAIPIWPLRIMVMLFMYGVAREIILWSGVKRCQMQ